MTKRRKHFTPEEKVAMLRRHLVEKVPVSTVCEEAAIPPSPRSFLARFAHNPLTWLLPVAFLFCYFHVFTWRFVPVFWMGDETIYFMQGVRLFDGQIVYKDFFQFLTPGTGLLYLALFKLFGIRLWIPSALFLLLGLALAWVTVAVSRRLYLGPSCALPVILYFGLCVNFAVDDLHHYYSLLGSMGCAAALMEGTRRSRLYLAGAVSGIVFCFNQAHGLALLGGLAVFLFWEARQQQLAASGHVRRQFSLSLSFVACAAAGCAYAVRRAGLSLFLSSVFGFPWRYYAADRRWNSLESYMADLTLTITWPRVVGGLAVLFIHAVVPLVYVLFLARYAAESKRAPTAGWRIPMLVNLVGFSLFLGIVRAPAVTRVQIMSLPGLIMLIWFMRHEDRLIARFRAALWIVAVILCAAGCVRIAAHPKQKLIQAGDWGRTVIRGEAMLQQFQWYAENRRKGELVWQAAHSGIYPLLGTRNPTRVERVTSNGYTRPEQVAGIIADLHRERVALVIWSEELSPPLDNRTEDNLVPLRAYLARHYSLVKAFPDGRSVLRRRGQ